MQNIILKLLRNLPPELAHMLTLKSLQFSFRNKKIFDDPILYQHLFGLDFSNPLGLAAGFDKNVEVVNSLLNLGFGFIEAGTVTPKPQYGNEKPRVFRLVEDSAVINHLGFNNKGSEYAKQKLRIMNLNALSKGIVGINIAINKDTTNYLDDYNYCLEKLGPLAHYVTINISSPNTPGLRKLQTSEILSKLLQTIDNERRKIEDIKGSSLQIWLKIAPDLDDAELKKLIDTAIDNNIDALCISNTTIERPNDLISNKKLENGGLSGNPLFYQSTLMLAKAYLHAQNKINFIGIGGIDSGETAYLKILAGATILQMYTGLVYNGPDVINKINSELSLKIGSATFSKIIGNKAYEIVNGNYLND